MPTLIRRLTSGLEPVDYTAASLNAAMRREPRDAVYTVTNTYHTTQVLKFNAHLDRLEDSARRAGIPLTLDRAGLRSALREVIVSAGYGDVRFRVTVPKAEPDTLLLTVEPFQPPSPGLYAQGVRVQTFANSARHNAAAKTTDWAQDRERLEQSLPEGVYTGLLLDERGAILEGFSSNFYAIREGTLLAAVEGVLPGISQQIVLEIAPGVLPVRLEPAHLADLPHIREAFITSASRGILPVVQIDETVLGDGTPGPLTRQLRQAYLGWVDRHLEEL